ncbi:conjugal transfer protein TraF [Helicobacter suis]|uniref:conjugal transfer protein TraF n=1 Tax=Helicobacter suis TaxID=104628 RepID=UPI0013D49F4D
MIIESTKRALLLCVLTYGGLEGLEFGGMGNTSFGMGGAGVALENSTWGLYYNPALLDIDDRTKFAYSFGVSVAQKNILSSLNSMQANGDPSSFYPPRIARLNGAHASSQNGLVVQIHPKLKKIKGGIGTFAIGVFASGFVGADILVNNPNNLYSSSNKAEARGLVLGSIPIGYAKGFDFHKWGKLSIGVDFKYIYSLSYGIGAPIDQLRNVTLDLSDMIKQSHFGLDLGAAYRIKGFTVGLVGKYLNAPKIKFNNGISSMRIDPQVRLGLGYRYKWLNLAWDLDLTSNKTLMLGRYSQMTGGGIMASFKWFAIKFGAMGNIASESLHQGIILTGGLRFFKVLDISVQSGLQTMAFNSIKIPNYLAVRVGGGWEW